MNKLKYIFVDAIAAEDLVSRRGMQSEEFDEGHLLGISINTPDPVQRKLSPKSYVIPGEEGIFILTAKSDHKNFLLIDLEEAPIFQNCSARESVTRFQKLLRFARRRWEKVSPSHSEMLLPGSSKGVLFPNPITTQSSLRITIELSPNKGGNSSADKGMEFLVYKIGTDEGGGVAESASVTNFNLAKKELKQADRSLEIMRSNESIENTTVISSLGVSRLSEGTVRGSIEGLTFDQWRDYLTEKQKDFIDSDLVAPYRIEGPAGTGKTLSLILKCISQLRKARTSGIEHRALFVAHSSATKDQIQSIFNSEEWLNSDVNLMSLQTLKVTTLHELCSEILRYEISETELLDRDAYESKQSQLLYAVEALNEVIQRELPSHRAHMSPEFIDFLAKSERWTVAEMIQQEISVVIKGRASFGLESYKQLPYPSYGLPLKNGGDKSFVYLIFNSYQKLLKAGQQFDTDDVVLSTLQQLSTPIWRRRREKEGYDSIYIDETHLFNINELSTFHRLTRDSDTFPIAYSADISQSLGDRGWSDVSFDDALLDRSGTSSISGKNQEFLSIFRCSPVIVDLAFSVTSSGAGLFVNFHDPLAAASSAFTLAEEKKCSKQA